MSINWTAEQKKAIDSRGNNLLVSAAAGSGKTAVMVERIKRLIIEDRVPIGSMVVVTFTNAAAADMRKKISDAIRDELDKRYDEFLASQLDDMPKAHISTFHVFATDIVRRYYYLVDVDSAFTIAGDTQPDFLKEEALDELFGEKFESEDEKFLDFINTYASSKNESAVREMILNIFNSLHNIPDKYEWLEKNIEQLRLDEKGFLDTPAYRELKQDVIISMNAANNYFRKTRDFLDSEGIASLAAAAAADIDMVDSRIDDIQSGGDVIEAVSAAKDSYQRFSCAKDEKEAWADAKKQAEPLRKKGKDIINNILSAYGQKPLREYVMDLNHTYEYALILKDLIHEFDETYSQKKKEKNILDFDDLIKYALEILSREEIADEYRGRIDYIFIDEYQDSNEIQDAMINRLKRSDNLFMVGDVKQCIYKFREAEPEIFISKYYDFIENGDKGELLLLNKNFRSRGPIIDVVNSMFSRLINRQSSGIDYEPLNLGAKEGDRPPIPAELHIINSDAEGDTAAHSVDPDDEPGGIELEALLAVDIIKKSAGMRYRDIAVLTRTHSAASVYHDVLWDAGIPAYKESGGGYYDTVEIETFINLLRVIDNKKQDIPLVSVLYSTIFGFTTEDLIKIRINAKDVPFYAAFEAYASGGDDQILAAKCQGVLDILALYKKDAAFSSLDEFIWDVMNKSGYYDYAGALPSGQQRQANLRSLVDKAAAYQVENVNGLFSFLNYVDRVKKSGGIEQVKLIGENDDVVRVMTMHGSKGLEYPMVIIGGLGKRFSGKDNKMKYRMHKDVGISLQWRDFENSAHQKTIMENIIDRKKKKEETAEEIRLLYVAATRAKERLVMIGSGRGASEQYADAEYFGKEIISAMTHFDILLPVVHGSELKVSIYGRSDVYSPISGSEIDITEQNVEKSSLMDETHMTNMTKDEIYEEVVRRLEYIYPYMNSVSMKSKFTVTELNAKGYEKAYAEEGERVSLAPVFTMDSHEADSDADIDDKSETAGKDAAMRGSAVHKVLEHLDFKTAYENRGDEKYFADVLEKLEEKGILDTEEKGVLSPDTLVRFVSGELFERAVNAKALYKETPFNFKTELEGEEVIVQGVIDMFFEEEDGVILVDYKTGNPRDPASLYGRQIKYYREALEAIKKIKVRESYIYLVDRGEAVLIP